MKYIFSVLIFISTSGFAMSSGGGGAHAFQFGAALSTATQGDLNNWVSSLNSAGTQQLSSAYEFSFSYMYRFSSSMFALAFRPSYFTQSATGGNVSQKLTGFLIYPMLRMYPLENSFIHFFMQIGLGWGQLSGNVSYSTTNGSADFSGNDFGAIGGLGADFCFTPSHCLTIEGNARYNPVQRSIVSSSRNAPINGTLSAPNGGELEYNNNDVQNTLSGIQGLMAYTFKF